MTIQVGARPLATLGAVERDLMTSSTGRLVAAAVLSAAMAAAASRPWGLGVLALVAFVPAFDAIARAPTALAGATLAAIASFGVASVGYEATVAIGVHIYALALLLALLPYAVAGAVAVRFGRAVDRCARRRAGVYGRSSTGSGAGAGSRHWAGRMAAVATLPLLWCAAEWLPAQPHLWGRYAMPLGAIGYSQVDLPTLQLARLSSVTAVSAVVLACNSLLVLTVWRTRLPVMRLMVLTALAGLALLVAVTWQRGSGAVGTEGALLHLVQPNLPDSAYLAASRLPPARTTLVDSLIALAAPPGGVTPALTILPEAAWPGPLAGASSSARQADPLLDDARLSGPVLFGAPARGSAAAESPATRSAPPTDNWYANSAYLLADGMLTRVQDKLHLVPIAEAGLRAGSGPSVFALGDLRPAVLICYDAAFPSSARAAAVGGASLLAVLTDDSFAARGDVPELHVRLAVFRAVETGLPVALASNTGPSVLIDSSGRIVARSPALSASSLTARLPLAHRVTAYSSHGDWLGVLALLAALPIAAVAAVRGGGAGSFGWRPT